MPTFNRSYSDEEKAAVIARALQRGSVNDAAQEYNINPTNIRRWADKAGIELSDEYGRARTAAATKAAQVKRRQQVEDSRGRQTLLLVTIAELAETLEIDILKDVKERLDKGEKLDRTSVSLRDIVGARTRALHDLALLNGDATERVDIVPTAIEAAATRDQIRERLRVIEGGGPIDVNATDKTA